MDRLMDDEMALGTFLERHVLQSYRDMDLPTFQEWKASSIDSLWLKGSVGAGKANL